MRTQDVKVFLVFLCASVGAASRETYFYQRRSFLLSPGERSSVALGCVGRARGGTPIVSVANAVDLTMGASAECILFSKRSWVTAILHGYLPGTR